MELLIKSQVGAIEENFEDEKKRLQEQLEAYKTVVFTEDTKKDAKDTVAQLRKDKKALQDRVKEVRVEYMKPFDNFLAKANELVALYDEPIDYINGQVAAFEEARKKEKAQQIKELYNEIIPEEEWQAVLPLAKIANPKWENATTTAKAIREELMRYKENAKTAYTSIKAMHSDKEAEALAMYNRSYNLSECMDFLNKFEEQKAEILERERKQEAEEAERKARADERAKIAQEQKHDEELAQAHEEGAQATIEQLTPVAGGEEVEYTYILRLNEDAKKKLELFLDSVGIEYFVM